MQQQDDLFGPEKLSLTAPAGTTAPRLWVRRLAIWEAPGGQKIRDISLRPGLNIVWSPDGADGADASGERAIGHGSGKTLFCRLLRYCLGEQRFADEAERELITAAFPDGIVGAEVILDGVCWAVVRPFVMRRRHIAIAGGNLDEIAAGRGRSTGIDPLIEAIEQALMTPAIASLARLQPGQKAWPIALAWLTRDQECRFDKVLDWRSPISGSGAPQPASGRESGPRLEAVRAFLRAITEEEQYARQVEEALRTEITNAERDRAHMDWGLGRRRASLIRRLGLGDQSLPDLPFLVEVFRKAANDRLAAAAQLPAGEITELRQARKILQDATNEQQNADDRRKILEAQLPLEKQILSQLRSEIPGLSADTQNAASQICHICDVPIDRALAEKCGVSHRLHNEAECRARLEKRHAEAAAKEAEIKQLEIQLRDLQPLLALAKQKFEQAQKRAQAIEDAREARSSEWKTANRIKDSVEEFSELWDERQGVQRQLLSLEQKRDNGRDGLAAFRDKQEHIFGKLTNRFSALIRSLVGDSANGKVKLSGNGLDISVYFNGERRTPAIESLKVLVFDLACLCLSIEGSTHLPAFLVHDSPREADLGLSIYDKLFHLIQEMEMATEATAFQYIVTTTTRPPDDLRCDPWLILTMNGTPGSQRLLKRDL